MLSTTADLNAFDKAISIWSNVTCRYNIRIQFKMIQSLNESITNHFKEFGYDQLKSKIHSGKKVYRFI